MSKSKAMKPKQPNQACLDKARNALQIAQQLEHGFPSRSGAYWCNHKDVLAVYYRTEDGGTDCTTPTGMTHDEAKLANTEVVSEGGGIIDFVAQARKERMH